MAFPILRSHGVQGCLLSRHRYNWVLHVPWWDHIAYVMNTARQRRFSLRYPVDLAVDIDENGIKNSLRDVLSLYKSPDNTDVVRFICDLKEATKGDDPPATLRRFLSWEKPER